MSVTPNGLAREVQALCEGGETDAIVLASAAPEYRRAIMDLASETLILHPVTQRYRDHHGYPRERTIGFGVMRGQGPELVADGALVDRSATPAHLALQRALQRGAGGMQ